MFDIEIHLTNEPGQLARMGEALGAANHSVEGGGMWTVDNVGVAHFLFEDGPSATEVLEAAGINVTACRPVIMQRLRQDEPGQLGKLTRAMADAGVNIEVLYSDHDHQLVLVVPEEHGPAAQAVSDAWMTDR